jgi:hypothetical protein
MPDQEPIIHDTVPAPDAAHAPSTLAYEPGEDDGDWTSEREELPRRARRRLLTPIPVALALVLLTACGFIGGVLVEKGQLSPASASAAGAGASSRFAALRGARSGAGATSTSGAARAPGSPGAGFGGSTSTGNATVGQVAFIQGATLYVTDTEGTTVKVTTSSSSTVTKTVKTTVKSIHPGETVIVTGVAHAHGAISAESIRVGASVGGGGLGSLLGGGAASGGAGSGSGRAAGSEAAGGAVQLFGKGG